MTSGACTGTGRAERGARMVGVTSTSEHEDRDERVFMHGVSWEAYESLLAARGERARPRIAYLDGELELMSPSPGHELMKKRIAPLLEFYCVDRGIELSGYGSWTIRRRLKQAGVEPDECYIFGRDTPEQKGRPDLAIEVTWTSGGIEKLEIYRRLGVPEVWFWEDDAIAIYALDGVSYVQREASAFVPGLELALVCRLAHCETLNDAIAGLRAALG
ncbi:MAG: Uma2 family endonuclease [Acidobacteriota bacterium]